MRVKIAALAASLIAAGAMGDVSAQQYVNGYYRTDGTYVQGHYRSQQNSTTLDNYSTQGNYNPYTGKRGTVDPYQQNNSLYTPPARTYNPPPPTRQRRSSYGY
ncbi:hypothetical protein [Stenotrophomonas sp.]|uniref:hypothetical protein n=1 Tax=Stenotrophomonas sp. TaxID=69392 RepID=UPI00289FAAAF|nr:hypothetical protein [Stenotrophomonas sp.]